jgi:hypothetical protein
LKIDWAARFAPTERFVIPSKNRETTDWIAIVIRTRRSRFESLRDRDDQSVSESAIMFWAEVMVFESKQGRPISTQEFPREHLG